MTLSANEVVTRYTLEIWNEGKVDLIRELCADPVVRHEADKVLKVSHDEQIDRIKSVRKVMTPVFENIIQIADETYVAAVYRCSATPVLTAEAAAAAASNIWLDEDLRKDVSSRKDACGIEIFKVVDGRITDVWNHPVMAGLWA